MFLKQGIRTPRMCLVALSPVQLKNYMRNPSALELDLHVKLSRDVVTYVVHRAMRIKLSKMASAAKKDYPWFTYWLMVIEPAEFGAGLIGFKGAPDSRGAVEVGYGIDPAYRGQGYTTEALQGLVQWAFQQDACKIITAQTVQNPPSMRVLEKSGFHLVTEDHEVCSFEIVRSQWEQCAKAGDAEMLPG